jgi:hypothetical protein
MTCEECRAEVQPVNMELHELFHQRLRDSLQSIVTCLERITSSKARHKSDDATAYEFFRRLQEKA